MKTTRISLFVLALTVAGTAGAADVITESRCRGILLNDVQGQFDGHEQAENEYLWSRRYTERRMERYREELKDGTAWANSVNDPCSIALSSHEGRELGRAKVAVEQLRSQRADAAKLDARIDAIGAKCIGGWNDQGARADLRARRDALADGAAAEIENALRLATSPEACADVGAARAELARVKARLQSSRYDLAATEQSLRAGLATAANAYRYSLSCWSVSSYTSALGESTDDVMPIRVGDAAYSLNELESVLLTKQSRGECR